MLTACSEKEETYTVTWKNYDGLVLEIDKDVLKGDFPKFDGNIPVRPETDEYKYSFRMESRNK